MLARWASRPVVCDKLIQFPAQVLAKGTIRAMKEERLISNAKALSRKADWRRGAQCGLDFGAAFGAALVGPELGAQLLVVSAFFMLAPKVGLHTARPLLAWLELKSPGRQVEELEEKARPSLPAPPSCVLIMPWGCTLRLSDRIAALVYPPWPALGGKAAASRRFFLLIRCEAPP